MSIRFLEECPCAINTTEAVNLLPSLPDFAILPAFHSAHQPIGCTSRLVEEWERGKERKTKAIDINDPPAVRGP